MSISLRSATFDDVPAIAALHADSWRRHYRGAYSDEYLDGPVEQERAAVWTARFADRSGTATVVAERAGDVALAGFVHVIFDAEPEFGPLIDNLHVRHDLQRQRIGEALMARAAEASLAARPDAPMHLWVLDTNARAQAFYKAVGGEVADQRDSEPPGGGKVTAIRIVWRDPACLLR